MSAKRTDMHRIQELVRLHRMQTGCREVAHLLSMGPNTERRLRQAVEKAGLLEGSPGDLPSLEELTAAVTEHLPLVTPKQQRSLAEPWKEEIKQMLSRGAGPKAIHDALRLTLGKSYTGTLWAVRRLYKRLWRERPVQPQEVVVTRVTNPGEEAQVDFGYVGQLYDPERGQLRRAWVFVVTLSHSRHLFCQVVFDQRTDTWLFLHVRAFEWFGAVPQVLVPDNTKAAVIRAAFGLTADPSLNRSYRELARHYGFKIDPTPPNDPRKKGGVESGVKYVKRNFFKPRQLGDIDEANRELERWVVEIAGVRKHGTTGRVPLEVFPAEDKPAMLPLPACPFTPVVWCPIPANPIS